MCEAAQPAPAVQLEGKSAAASAGSSVNLGGAGWAALAPQLTAAAAGRGVVGRYLPKVAGRRTTNVTDPRVAAPPAYGPLD